MNWARSNDRALFIRSQASDANSRAGANFLTDPPGSGTHPFTTRTA
jgi:hypothetical protein